MLNEVFDVELRGQSEEYLAAPGDSDRAILVSRSHRENDTPVNRVSWSSVGASSL